MLKCYYEFEKFGEKNWKSRKYISKSFVKAFLSSLYVSTSSISFNTLNTNNASASSGGGFRVSASGGFSGLSQTGNGENNPPTQPGYKIGIQVGTGNAAVAAVDHDLETPILHGITSGKLEYFGMLISDITVSDPNASFFFERIFRNSSGGSITVNEIGCNRLGATGNYAFCIIRDVLGSPVTVDDGEYLKVKYTIQITV